MGLFSKGLKNEFETAVVNEPSVFEPSKFYCNSLGDLEKVDGGIRNIKFVNTFIYAVHIKIISLVCR